MVVRKTFFITHFISYLCLWSKQLIRFLCLWKAGKAGACPGKNRHSFNNRPHKRPFLLGEDMSFRGKVWMIAIAMLIAIWSTFIGMLCWGVMSFFS